MTYQLSETVLTYLYSMTMSVGLRTPVRAHQVHDNMVWYDKHQCHNGLECTVGEIKRQRQMLSNLEACVFIFTFVYIPFYWGLVFDPRAMA
jgi:hypothetical protein